MRKLLLRITSLTFLHDFPEDETSYSFLAINHHPTQSFLETMKFNISVARTNLQTYYKLIAKNSVFCNAEEYVLLLFFVKQ